MRDELKNLKLQETRQMKDESVNIATEAAAGGQPASICSDFTIEHSCGAWRLYRGDEPGRVAIKTRSRGKSIGVRRKLGKNPPQIENSLVAANAEQFGVQNTSISGADPSDRKTTGDR